MDKLGRLGRVYVGFFKNDKEVLRSECEACDNGSKLYPDDAVYQFDRVLQELQA